MTEAVADPIPNDVAVSDTDKVVCSSVPDSPIADMMNSIQLEDEKQSENSAHKQNGFSVHDNDKPMEPTVTSVDDAGCVTGAEDSVSSKTENYKSFEKDDLPLVAAVDDGVTGVMDSVADAECSDDVDDIAADGHVVDDDNDDEVLHRSMDSTDFKKYLTLGHEIGRSEENTEFIGASSPPKPSVDESQDSEHTNSCKDGSIGNVTMSGVVKSVSSDDITHGVENSISSDDMTHKNKETSIDKTGTITDSLLIDIGSTEAMSDSTSTQLGITVDQNANNNEDKSILHNQVNDSEGGANNLKTNMDLLSFENQTASGMNSEGNENSCVVNSTDLSHQKVIKCEKFNQQVSVDSSIDDHNVHSEGLSSHIDSSISETTNQNHRHEEVVQQYEAGCPESSFEHRGRVLCACGELLINDLNEGEFDDQEYEGEFHEEFDDYHVEGFQTKHSRKVTFIDNNNVHSAGVQQFNSSGLLQSQLDQTEKETRRKEEEYIQEITELKRENQRQQKLIGQNLTLSPQAKIEATMQHEITRMTAENLDLRETIDKQMDQIRKLKKMLRVYSKKLKDGEAAEIQAEIEQEEQRNENDQLATVKHRERNYMGMLEYRKEDEGALIKNLVIDLKPRLAYELIPGLPAYILFMCVRHTDYTNDDEKVRSLLTATINSIKKVVKKHNNDIERVTLWLANTCRLLHTLKQYSGEKAFQAENTPKQNEQTLRNFDLSEYRQVFSDLAVWIYQSLIKSMEECTQPNIVPAVLEHEAIAGLTASKPSGLRGRTSSSVHEQDAKEYSLDTLMKALNNYMRILTLNAVDPELVKQIFRQVYYFICAGSLNNLLLRKDMCNWSKGMQIRYNLSHLEQWLRDNKLHESGAVATLEPIVQASQLLQARKTDADVDGICEMCSKLSVAQIVKILNLYTPVDEFEERVPISFIRKIQEKLRSRGDENNTLLMETSFTYPVTFPFNPSSIALESITVPEHLHLGFLKKI